MPRGRPKGSGKGMQVKQVPVQFDPADDVQALAVQLIPKYHSHLVPKMEKIAYLFKNKKITNKGKEVAATAEKCSKKVTALCGMEFVITVSYEVWKNLSDEMKTYVIDHELSHCWIEDREDGEEQLQILPHSFEDFTDLVRRYGAMTVEIKKLQTILNGKKDVEEENVLDAGEEDSILDEDGEDL